MEDNISYQKQIEQYSLEELYDVAEHIDREKASERFRMVVAEIKKRQAQQSDNVSGEMSQGDMMLDTRPLGISILAFLYFTGGIAILGLQLFFGRQLIQGIESIGMSGLHGILAILLIGMLMLAGGIGLWAGKKWGWWVGALYLFHSVMRNAYALAIIPDVAANYGMPDQGLGYYFLKHGGRILIHSLIAVYFFLPKVTRYFHVERLSSVKRFGILVGVSVCLVLGFLFSSSLLNQNELKQISMMITQGDFQTAHSRIVKYLESHPDNEIAWTVKGKILYNMDRKTEAKEAYMKAIEINPENFQALHTLGLLAREEEDYDAAIAYYQQAITINPRYARTYSSMSVIELKRYNDQQALEYALKGYQYDNKNPVIAANLAIAYHYSGLLEERDRMTKVAQELGYDSMEALYQIYSGKLTIRE